MRKELSDANDQVGMLRRELGNAQAAAAKVCHDLGGGDQRA